MWISGHMNTLFLIGGLVLAGVLVILSSLFFIGHFKPRMLFRVFLLIEKLVNKILGIFKKSLKTGWGRSMAHSFVNTSDLLAKNPLGSIITVAYASFSAILNMACLVAIGYAFGFENVESLVAAFAVAAISVILSPTQGYRLDFRNTRFYYRRCEHRVCFQPEPFHAVYNAYLVDRYELAYGGCSAYRELAFPDGLLDRACDAIPHGLGVDHRLTRTDRGLGVLWMFWKRAAFDRPFSREAVQADLEEWKKRREKKRAQAEAKRNHVGKRSTDEARADEANAANVNAAEAQDVDGTPAEAEDDSDVPDISGWEENVKRGRNLGEEYIATSGVTIPDVDSPEAK